MTERENILSHVIIKNILSHVFLLTTQMCLVNDMGRRRLFELATVEVPSALLGPVYMSPNPGAEIEAYLCYTHHYI